jgi:hypothetical protein
MSSSSRNARRSRARAKLRGEECDPAPHPSAGGKSGSSSQITSIDDSPIPGVIFGARKKTNMMDMELMLKNSMDIAEANKATVVTQPPNLIATRLRPPMTQTRKLVKFEPYCLFCINIVGSNGDICEDCEQDGLTVGYDEELATCPAPECRNLVYTPEATCSKYCTQRMRN